MTSAGLPWEDNANNRASTKTRLWSSHQSSNGAEQVDHLGCQEEDASAVRVGQVADKGVEALTPLKRGGAAQDGCDLLMGVVGGDQGGTSSEVIKLWKRCCQLCCPGNVSSAGTHQQTISLPLHLLLQSEAALHRERGLRLASTSKTGVVVAKVGVHQRLERLSSLSEESALRPQQARRDHTHC